MDHFLRGVTVKKIKSENNRIIKKKSQKKQRKRIRADNLVNDSNYLPHKQVRERLLLFDFFFFF